MLNRLTRTAAATATALVFTLSPALAQDCNANGIPDADEILQGLIDDLNLNGVPDECEDIENITQGTFWLHVQDAVDASDAGDEIVLEPGDYDTTHPSELLLVHAGHDLTIRGTDPDDLSVVAATRLAADSEINIQVAATERINLRGLTTATVEVNGVNFGEVTIDRCIFDGTDHPQGGSPTIGTEGTAATIRVVNSIFTECNTMFGYYGDPNTNFTLYVEQSLVTCTEGILNWYSDEFSAVNVVIDQSTFDCSSNAIDMDLNPTVFSNLTIRSSIIRGGVAIEPGVSTTPRSSNIEGFTPNPTHGVIDADPMFTDTDGPDNDPATVLDNDYCLLSGSPCIDTGDNALIPPDTIDLDNDGDTAEQLPLDLALNTRVVDGTVDMGPYEFQGPPPCPADLAAPFGTLNFFDVAAFISLYNAADPAADFAAPFGTLNFFDVAAFIAAYNAGCP